MLTRCSSMEKLKPITECIYLVRLLCLMCVFCVHFEWRFCLFLNILCFISTPLLKVNFIVFTYLMEYCPL